MPEGNPMEPGLYESRVTRRIEDALAVLGELAKTAPIEPADAHVALTRHLAKHIAAALRAAPDLEAKLVLANAILESLHELTHGRQDLAIEAITDRSEEHTSELQSPDHLVCRLLLEKKKK